jgi:hypothetical protein
MDGLSRIWTDPGRHEHQPGQKFPTRDVAARRKEPPGLVGQVQQDGVAVEDDGIAVGQGRRLCIRINGDEIGVVLIALADIDRRHFVRESRFLEEERHFRWIGAGIVVEADHEGS